MLFEIEPEMGISVVQQALRPEDLYSADGVFISSTNRNLLGVGQINSHKIAAAPVPVTRQLDQWSDNPRRGEHNPPSLSREIATGHWHHSIQKNPGSWLSTTDSPDLACDNPGQNC